VHGRRMRGAIAVPLAIVLAASLVWSASAADVTDAQVAAAAAERG
jgi:hypothetical protein